MNVQNLIQTKNFQLLVQAFTPKVVATHLTFQGGLKLAHQLFSYDKATEKTKEYAVFLLHAISALYTTEWNSSWKHDAFLGKAYRIEDEDHDSIFSWYKRAMEATDSPPPRLLIEMARCCQKLGYPRLPTIEAIDFLKDAIKDYLYPDAVVLLSTIYAFREEPKEHRYWKDVYNSIKDTNTPSPSIDPEGIQEEIRDKDFKDPWAT